MFVYSKITRKINYLIIKLGRLLSLLTINKKLEFKTIIFKVRVLDIKINTTH